MKPVIGITANYMFDGSAEFAEGIGAAEQEWQKLADDYITSVQRAGGIPIILPVLRNDSDWEITLRLADCVDGVLFSGGSDVDPLHFGQASTGKTGNVIPERDEQELFLFHHLLEHTKKPLLGICRGIQLFNVALGGTLIQHIPDKGLSPHTLPMYPRQHPSHWVNVENDSLLKEIVRSERLGVNSFHHMAVERCAPGLRAAAWSEDGILEAVELNNPSDRFFLAVQWHPEMMTEADTTQQNIITAFVQSCV
ncbi:MAG: gamma-glutamyl-gamma-aminobutyrate hydrolase family protein [Lachnospiraceae bacterium]|nr:gamma-glutamyl-gamma-aminobutyrate hydrolase family protein [Lachnospiraceae bacterium]